MKSFTFRIRFRLGSTKYYETAFRLNLYDDEIAFIKAYLKENGDLPFWAFDYKNEALFKRFLAAYIAAFLGYINKNLIKPGEAPYTEETVCWEEVYPEFYWPKNLLDS